MDNKIRTDKYLWSMRVYKTRALAADACKRGRVVINNIKVKAGKIIHEGDEIAVYKAPVQYMFRVIKPAGKRLPAKLVPDYMEDLTTEEEKCKLLRPNLPGTAYREKGTGRPTKKDRRIMDKYQGEADY